MKFCRITDAPITAGNVGNHSHPVFILCLAKVPFHGWYTGALVNAQGPKVSDEGGRDWHFLI